MQLSVIVTEEMLLFTRLVVVQNPCRTKAILLYIRKCCHLFKFLLLSISALLIEFLQNKECSFH